MRAQVRRHCERNVAHVAAKSFDALVHRLDVRAQVRTLRERLVALFALKRLQFVVHAADVRVERVLQLGAVFAMRALELARSAATNSSAAPRHKTETTRSERENEKNHAARGSQRTRARGARGRRAPL